MNPSVIEHCKLLRSRCVALLCVLSIALSASSCRSNELSRDKATQLLKEHSSVQTAAKNLRLRERTAKQTGIDLDYWNSRGDLSDAGRRTFESVSVPNTAVLRTPLSISIEPTGIAPVPASPGMAEVQFRWTLRDVTGPLASLIIADGVGSAAARRYDDGWRIDGIQLNPSENAITMSEGQSQALKTLIDQVIAERRSRVAAAQSAYNACTTVDAESAVSVTGVAGYAPRSQVGHIPIRGLRLGKAGLVVLGEAGTTSAETFASLKSIQEPERIRYGNDFTKRSGAVASVVFYTDDYRDLLFTSMEGAQEFHRNLAAAMDSWRKTCGPAVAEWDYVRNERQYWKGL